MRVLVFALNYAPEKTGCGLYTGEMSEWLAARGHRVDVVTTPPYYPEWKVHEGYSSRRFVRERINGVNVARGPIYVPSGKVGLAGRLALEATFGLSAARYWIPILLGRKRYDVVVVINPPFQAGSYPWLYRLLRRVPWVFHVQDLQAEAAVQLGFFGGGPIPWLVRTLESFLLRRATLTSTITEAMLDRIVEKGVPEESAFLFPNWSDLSRFRPDDRGQRFRELCNAGPEDALVLYSGNFGQKQGLEVIVEAADKLRDRSRIRFALVGQGVTHAKIEGMARERGLPITFLPLQPFEDLPALLAAGDIHVIPQRGAAADLLMPSKLVNILAAGRPVIVTAVEGTQLHKVVTTAEAGRALTPEDADQMAAAIEELAGDPALRQRLGTAARAYADTAFDKERILLGLEERLSGLV